MPMTPDSGPDLSIVNANSTPRKQRPGARPVNHE
jgi:hypothetical protein